jgi:5-methylcytosine-specific restriction endonuclease McrA
MFDASQPIQTETSSSGAGSTFDDWATASDRQLDELVRDLIGDEAEISRMRARQIARLRRADHLQADTTFGARTMADWVTATLDVSPQTAGRMMRIARADETDIETSMGLGDYGIDRAAFLCQLRSLGGPEDVISDSLSYSLGHLYGLCDRLRTFSPLDETEAFEQRYMVLQPSLDESVYKFWGHVPGVDGRIWDRALELRESELPSLPQQSQGQRRVDAVTSIMMDSLTTGIAEQTGRAVTVAEVFVDANLAGPSFGEVGVSLSTGPRVGPGALSEILCAGRVRVIYRGEDGRPIGVSERTQTIPPAVRNFVLQRDQGRCQIDGCRSSYRLQPHHVRPRSDGGDHDPDNLISLCWYHHHVAIHMMGMFIDPASPIHRRRLLRFRNNGPPKSRHPTRPA